MKKSILIHLLRQSRKLLPDHPQFNCYPHFSFIFQNDKLLGYGVNSPGSPPIYTGFQKRIFGGKPKIHSEWNCYQRVKSRLSNKTFICVNIRLNKKGETKLAKPCSCCSQILTDLGCLYFYFSDENEKWLKLKCL